RNVTGAGVERLAQARPQADPLAVLVLVEPGTARPTRTVQLVDHLVDDRGRAVRRRQRAALGLDAFLGRLADLLHQRQRQLVGQLQRRSGATGLRTGLLDRRGLDALAHRGQRLVEEHADDAAGEEPAAVVDHDRRLADRLDVVEDL